MLSSESSKLGFDVGRAIGEQPDRGRAGGCGGAGRRHRERLDGELARAADGEGGAARREHLEPGGSGEDLVDQRRGREHVGEVVDQEQQRPLAEALGDRLGERSVRGLAHPEHPGDRRADELGVLDRCEVDEECLPELILERARDLERQARLARPPEPGQGDEAHAGLAQERRDRLELLLASPTSGVATGSAARLGKARVGGGACLR